MLIKTIWCEYFSCSKAQFKLEAMGGFHNRADTKSDGILDEDEFVFTFLPLNRM